jgi:hypothetical protein
MARNLTLMLVVTLLAGASAWAAAYQQHRQRLAIQSVSPPADEVPDPAHLARYFSDLVRQSDYVILNFLNLHGQKEILVRDRDWLDRVADLLAAAVIRSTQKHHFGIGAPNLEFFRDYEKVLHVDALGMDILRAYGIPPDENDLTHRGDYQVDEATVVAYRALLREKIPPTYLGRGK